MGTMICLLIGLIVIRAKSITLRSFQAVYLLLGAANVALCYVAGVDILFPIIALAVGLLLTLLATGMFGRSDTSSHYETLLVGVGLFPWYLSWRASLVYIVAAIVFCVYLKLSKNIVAMHSVYYPVSSIWKPSKKLPEDKLAIYREKSFTILTTPVGVAAVVATLAFATQF
jgi:hypothetical protein